MEKEISPKVVIHKCGGCKMILVDSVKLVRDDSNFKYVDEFCPKCVEREPILKGIIILV